MSARRKGFSLIELIIVIVVVAIAAVAIGSAFAYMSRSLALNQDLQLAWQIAHECADHVLAQGRRPRGSYASVAVANPSTVCNAIPTVSGYNRTVAVSTMGTTALCDAGWNCKRVLITVTRGNVTATLNLMLVDS